MDRLVEDRKGNYQLFHPCPEGSTTGDTCPATRRLKMTGDLTGDLTEQLTEHLTGDLTGEL